MNRQARSWLQFDRPATIPRAEVCRPLGVCEPQALWNAVSATKGPRHQGPPPGPVPPPPC